MATFPGGMPPERLAGFLGGGSAQRSITLCDLPALAEIAGFTDDYLHVHIDEAA